LTGPLFHHASHVGSQEVIVRAFAVETLSGNFQMQKVR